MIEKQFVEQGIKRIALEEYLKKQLEKAGYTKSDIVKTPLVTRIVVNVTRPGLAIGKGGQNIRTITREIEEKFAITNPQIEIKQIEIPELDAQAVADKMKSLIERGFSWRSIAHRTIKDIMNAGAQGVEIRVGGKLTGKGGRKRKQRIGEGYMKKVGDQVKLIEHGKAAAYPKVGAIGIKIRIVKPETLFPDKFNITEYLEKKELKEKEDSEKKEEAVEKVEETTEKKKKRKEKKGEKKKEGTEKKKEEKGKTVEKEKAKKAKEEEKEGNTAEEKNREKAEKKKTETKAKKTKAKKTKKGENK